MTFVINLSKAGTNPDQRPRATITGPTDPRKEGLKIGDVFHADGQPKDVLWKVERIFERKFARPTGRWMNGKP